MGIQIDADIPNCSECGAMSYDGLTCLGRLHGLLALEQHDAALQALHFLTVAAYNIQHPAAFTPEAVVSLRQSFLDYLDGRITLEQVKERSREFDGANKVLKPVADRTPILRVWPVTTADVYKPSQPQGTAERAKKWVESIKSEL